MDAISLIPRLRLRFTLVRAKLERALRIAKAAEGLLGLRTNQKGY
jgi:hypothetical protein